MSNEFVVINLRCIFFFLWLPHRYWNSDSSKSCCKWCS